MKKPEYKSSIPAKITPELRELIDSEQHINETVSDTILRLIRVARQDKIAYRKKAEALEEEIEILHSKRVRDNTERYLIKHE